MMRMVRWLHISDLHLGSTDLSTDRLRNELLSFLQKEGFCCDYVFCTGDIRTAGKGDHPFTDDMAEYLRDLCEAANTPVENLFIVPGNHDVDRGIRKRISAIKRVKFNWSGYYEPASGIIEQKDLAAIMEGEKDFVNFLSKIYPAHRTSLYGNPERPHFNIETRDFNILHVDSTVSYTEGQEATNLIIGTHLLYKEILQLNKAKPTIILTHYPFTSLLQDEKKQLSILLHNNGIKLWLSGHEHDHSLQPISYIDSIQTGELRYENNANASFVIGEYNPNTGRGFAKVYAWYPEGWALYPFVDLSNKQVDRYDFLLKPLANDGKSKEKLAAQKANEAHYHRLPAKVETALLPIIKDRDRRMSLDELLAETWQSETPHIILLADGGMGKTTMLLDYCKRASSAVLYVPAELLVTLDLGIEDYCASYMYDGDKELLKECLCTKYSDPSLTILVDGLNEVDGEAERKLVTELQRLNILLKGLMVVVTSRSNFTVRYSMPGYRPTQLLPLEDEQICQYFSVEDWTKIRRNGGLHRLLCNPMMLTVYKDVSSLIDEYKDVEFLDWSLPVRNISDLLHNYYVAQLALMLKRGVSDGKRLLLAAICINEILPGIAYAYECSHRQNQAPTTFRKLLDDVVNRAVINEADLIPIQEKFRVSGLPEMKQQDIKDMLTSEMRLLYWDSSVVAFPHQMFRDYLSAEWILRQSNSDERIFDLWNNRIIPHPLMVHIRQRSGRYWDEGLACKVHHVGKQYKGDNAGLLVENLLNTFPASTDSGTPDYSGLWLRGHQLPDNSVTSGKIIMREAEIDDATMGLLSGEQTFYTCLCLSEDKRFLATIAIKDGRKRTEIQIYSIEEGKLVFYYTLNKLISKMEFHDNRLFVVSGNLLVFTLSGSEWHYTGEIGEKDKNITQKLKLIVATEGNLYLYYYNRLLTYSLHDCRRTDIVNGKLWENPVQGKNLTSLRRSVSWSKGLLLKRSDILSEVGDDSLRARSYGDGRLVVESGDEILLVLSKGGTLLMSAAVSGDGKRAATLGFQIIDDTRRIQLWDLDEERRICYLTCPAVVKNIHLSQNGRWIMGEARESTWIYDTDSGLEHWYNFHFVSNHAGRLVTYGSKVVLKRDRTLYLYDLETEQEELLETPVPNPRLVCFLPNGSVAAVDETGKYLYLRSTWDNNILFYYMEGKDILSIQAVNGKPFIAVFTSEKNIRIYHTGKNQCLIKNAGSSKAMMLVAHQEIPLLAYSDGQRYLETRNLYDWQDGKTKSRWYFNPYKSKEHSIDADVLDIAFNAKNNRLVAILDNGRIMFCHDKYCKYEDSFKIITSFNVDAYDFKNCICSEELKMQLRRNGAEGI